MKKLLFAISAAIFALAVASCFSSMGGANASGGEVTGIGGTSMSEPAPYGMVLVKRGSLKMGTEKTDSLWGKDVPTRDISVDAFWILMVRYMNPFFQAYNHQLLLSFSLLSSL